MRKKAMEVMLILGISANTKGFTYIADAMEVMDEAPELRYHICNLYQKIADRYPGATMSRVERAIRHVFQSVCTNACLEDVERWLTATGKQSNGNLLTIFYMKLKEEV